MRSVAGLKALPTEKEVCYWRARYSEMIQRSTSTNLTSLDLFKMRQWCGAWSRSGRLTREEEKGGGDATVGDVVKKWTRSLGKCAGENSGLVF